MDSEDLAGTLEEGTCRLAQGSGVTLSPLVTINLTAVYPTLVWDLGDGVTVQLQFSAKPALRQVRMLARHVELMEEAAARGDEEARVESGERDPPVLDASVLAARLDEAGILGTYVTPAELARLAKQHEADEQDEFRAEVEADELAEETRAIEAEEELGGAEARAEVSKQLD